MPFIKNRDKKTTRLVIMLARTGLVVWLLILVKYILFKHQWYVIRNYFRDEFPYYTLQDGWDRANMVPFRSIINILKHNNEYQFWIGNITGNIAGFIPVGFLAPLSGIRCQTAAQTILFTGILSCFFECTQCILGTGIMDIDDLLLNLTGGAAGFGLLWLAGKLSR